MKKKLNMITKKIDLFLYPAFRIIVGLLFFQHGLQKMFGFFGGIDGAGGLPPVFSLIWWSGIIEFLAGFLVTFGILARVAAFFAAVEMIIGYFLVHNPSGPFPILNGGEPALLYMASFIVILRKGAGKFSLEKLFHKK